MASPGQAVTLVLPLDGQDDVAKLWNVFSKSKGALQDGRRLENLSWRLWHQATLHSLPPASSSGSVAQATEPLSDPEGGCSDSSLSDGSPGSTYNTRRRSPLLAVHSSTESASSAPTVASRLEPPSSGPAPTRMSPSSLQTLIHKVLDPTDWEATKMSALKRAEAAPAQEAPIAQRPPLEQPPDTAASEAVNVPPDSREQEREDVEGMAAASVRSRMSEGSTTSSRGHARRARPAHGHAHSRARTSAASNLRRNMSERALAQAPAPLTQAQTPAARPSLPSRNSGPVSANGEKPAKTVRIVEDAAPEMARTSSKERDRPGHHRRTSSALSVRSNPRSSGSSANLTSLEPQSVVRGFGAGSVTSLASLSPSSAGPTSASPSKPSSLRQSASFRAPTPPPPGGKGKETGKSRMFFVGSEQAEEADGDSSSGWGSDPEDNEVEPEAPAPVPAPRTPLVEPESSMFSKRPVRSAVDLAIPSSEMPRTASQGLLTALFSADPYALSRHPQRPADRAAALLPSKSAVSLPARRLGGPPPDVELSDDEDDEEAVTPAPDAVPMPRAYNISNAAARAVVQPPLQLSASQTRRNMLTTELSESLRRNLLWERQSQPGARDRRIVDRRIQAQAKQLMTGQTTAGHTAPASVAVDTTNYFSNNYHRQGW